MLDRRFFERSATRVHKNSMFESYKAVYVRSTMVLFSRKTKTPLAALTLKADDVGCLSMLTGRPSPKGTTEPHFQGMFSMPDQTFTFTISNLSDKGMINFNILHTPHTVSFVDPGPAYGVNQVNELHKNQSYTVEADQRTNRAMVLSGKTKAVKDPVTGQEKEVPLTVKDSEAIEKPTGLYFYLSVVPDKACMGLVDKFAEGTVWQVVPGFVRRVEGYQIRPPMELAFAPSSQISLPSATGRAIMVRNDDIDNMLGIRMMLGISMERAPPSSRWRPPTFEQSSPTQQEDKERSCRFVGAVDVGSTQAGELSYGRKVEVSSSYTGHDYSYEHCSEPTVLCMSIWEDMKFLPLSDIKEELEAEVNEWIVNEGKALIESLNAVYKSETCVIDMESEADTIICTCGHQCIHHDNVSISLRKCPICRCAITAFVRADGILVG